MPEDDVTEPQATDSTATPGSDGRTFTQDEVNRFLAEEKRKLTSRYADYDALREKADQWEALAAASQTDTERAVTEAREAAWQAAMAHAVPRVVTAEFRAEAARQGIAADQLDAIVEDLDLIKYATDDGDPDVDRIKAKLSVFAPQQPQRRNGPSPSGLGNRGSDVNATPKDVAASYLAKKFPSRAKAR